MRRILYTLSIVIIFISCQKKQQLEYSQTSQGRLKFAQELIKTSLETNSSSFLEVGIKELDSIIILFPNSKEALVADSIIKNKSTIYAAINGANKEKAKMIDDYLKLEREKYEPILTTFFLELGLKVKVKIGGDKSTVMELSSASLNEIMYRKFETQGLFEKWARMGFKQITLSDGRKYFKNITFQ